MNKIIVTCIFVLSFSFACFAQQDTENYPVKKETAQIFMDSMREVRHFEMEISVALGKPEDDFDLNYLKQWVHYVYDGLGKIAFAIVIEKAHAKEGHCSSEALSLISEQIRGDMAMIDIILGNTEHSLSTEQDAVVISKAEEMMELLKKVRSLLEDLAADVSTLNYQCSS